jgi:spore maturation protein CgeB
MKLVVFGLAVSSTWANDHATLWRSLIRVLAGQGHALTFYEQDTPYFAAHRDYKELPKGELVVYETLDSIRAHATHALRSADAAIVSSYAADALAATELVMSSAVPIRAFYEFDTAVTLRKVRAGERVSHLGPRGLRDFDVVMSSTGGAGLSELQRVLGAHRVAPLYPGVDLHAYSPVAPVERYQADLAYLGTYEEEHNSALEELLLKPARALPEASFVIGGASYPRELAWPPNLKYVWHVAPAEHSALYCSARLNLNVTRACVAALGYCPSGRMFEAAACGAPMITDRWPGLAEFYEPGDEILVARDHSDVIAALKSSRSQLQALAHRARERTLAQHSIEHRAEQLLEILSTAHAGTREFERENAEVMRGA